jgi:Helix-turn-helix domain
MPREIEEREPLHSSIKPAREPNRGDRMLTPKEAVNFLRVSESWLAKARMRGDGPPYAKFGRAVRYPEAGSRRLHQISAAAVDERALEVSPVPMQAPGGHGEESRTTVNFSGRCNRRL